MPESLKSTKRTDQELVTTLVRNLFAHVHLDTSQSADLTVSPDTTRRILLDTNLIVNFDVSSKENSLPSEGEVVRDCANSKLDAIWLPGAPLQAPMPPPAPPSLLQGVFWLILPRKLRDAIMGDAAEAHAQTIERYGPGFMGRSLANVDYLKEAVFACIAALRMSAADWIQIILRRSL